MPGRWLAPTQLFIVIYQQVGDLTFTYRTFIFTYKVGDYHLPYLIYSHARNVIFTFLVGDYHLPCSSLSSTRKVMVTYQVDDLTCQECDFYLPTFWLQIFWCWQNMWNYLEGHAGSQGYMWNEGKYVFFLKCACHMKNQFIYSRFYLIHQRKKCKKCTVCLGWNHHFYLWVKDTAVSLVHFTMNVYLK